MKSKISQQEHSAILDSLKALYKGATIDNAKSFEAYRMNRRNGAKRQLILKAAKGSDR